METQRYLRSGKVIELRKLSKSEENSINSRKMNEKFVRNISKSTVLGQGFQETETAQTAPNESRIVEKLPVCRDLQEEMAAATSNSVLNDLNNLEKDDFLHFDEHSYALSVDEHVDDFVCAGGTPESKTRQLIKERKEKMKRKREIFGSKISIISNSSVCLSSRSSTPLTEFFESEEKLEEFKSNESLAKDEYFYVKGDNGKVIKVSSLELDKIVEKRVDEMVNRVVQSRARSVCNEVQFDALKSVNCSLGKSDEEIADIADGIVDYFQKMKTVGTGDFVRDFSACSGEQFVPETSGSSIVERVQENLESSVHNVCSVSVPVTLIDVMSNSVSSNLQKVIAYDSNHRPRLYSLFPVSNASVLSRNETQSVYSVLNQPVVPISSAVGKRVLGPYVTDTTQNSGVVNYNLQSRNTENNNVNFSQNIGDNLSSRKIHNYEFPPISPGVFHKEGNLEKQVNIGGSSVSVVSDSAAGGQEKGAPPGIFESSQS